MSETAQLEDEKNMKRIKRIFIAAVALSVPCFWNVAQGEVPITGIQVAPDGGIIISWTSGPDKIYQIQFTPELTEPVKWHELWNRFLQLVSHFPRRLWW